MKKTILLLLIVLSTTTAFSQGMFNLFGKTEDVFSLMTEEKFPEAYAFFDTSFQSKVPVSKLQEMWVAISAKLGKMQSVNVISSKKQGEIFVLSVEGKFANDSQNFTVAYNKAEKIVGFFLQPKSEELDYVRPAYADTTLYTEKEIYVKTEKHNLVGLLTLPKKAVNFPLVVLVHGSGPNDMDGTFGPNKPLRDLAAGFAAKGIASIRYVKRTMLYSNEFVGAYTVKEEVLDDALAAIALARTTPGVNKKQLYLLGHSLGGMLAPRIATLAPDLSGIILLAAPARKLTELIVEQNNYLYALAKDTTAAGKQGMAEAQIEFAKTNLTSLGTTIKPDSALLGLPAAYWVDLNTYNQIETAKKLKQRIFIAQGGNDFQVSMTDFDVWTAALGKRKNVTLKSYVDLNHLLSTQTEKGSAAQYRKPGNVSSVLVDDLTAWITAK